MTTQNRSPSLSEDGGDAAFAVGRLAEAARRSPVVAAWQLRETAHVAAVLASRNFGPSRAEDLFAIVAGAPRARVLAAEQTLLALAFWRHALRRWFVSELPSPWAAQQGEPPDDEDEDDAWPAVTGSGTEPVAAAIGAICKGPSASFAAMLRRAVAVWQKDRGTGDIELALPLAFRARTGVLLPAVALAMPAVRRRHEDSTASTARCAARLAIEADAAYSRLIGLERASETWRDRLPRQRVHSRLPDVLRLLARSPMLTATGVAAALDITPRAAAGHLNDLEALQIVREITGRPRWRLFCATDLPLQTWERKGSQQKVAGGVAEFADPARSQPNPQIVQKQRPAVDLGEIDRMLGDVYREVDRATARIGAMLDKR